MKVLDRTQEIGLEPQLFGDAGAFSVDLSLVSSNDFKEASSEEASLTVTGGCTWPISIDKSQLKRVLDNLIDNGLRHSESATGQRTVDLHIGQSVVQRLCFIDVIDNGEGVPDSAQARLFEPFFTTRPDGTGLGLYLCKELCESNKGRCACCFRSAPSH